MNKQPSIQWYSSIMINGLPSKNENNSSILISTGLSILSNTINTQINLSSLYSSSSIIEGHTVVMYYDINKQGRGKICITNNLNIKMIIKLMKTIVKSEE